MAQLTSTHFAESTLLDLPQRVVHSSGKSIAWQIVQRMTDAGASAVGLPDGFLITSRASRQPGIVLVPTRDAIRRLEHAQTAVDSLDSRPIVLSCTNAREAQSLTDDEDSRDRRYLSGVRTIDGFHVYCGGIDAAISRALACAPHADVVCYRASKLDLAEAERFASAMRASFPGKQLGMGFSPSSHELQWSGLDHANHDKMLRKLGYDYYFCTQLGSVAFPAFPHARPWALFDDGAEPADSSGLGESHRPLS
jgi:isocitrate lyase